MSSRSLPAIEIDVRLPAVAAPVLVMAAGGAAAVPILLASGPAAWLTGGLAFMLSIAAFHQAGWLGGPRALQSARWDADGQWWLTDRAGSVRSARLGTGTRVFAGWLWLSWEGPGCGRHALLRRGHRDADTLRRLAVRLRLAAFSRPVESPGP